MENYYSVLGVVHSASEEEIKRAYRKLSVKMHPDKNEGDDFFEEFFKKINEAYYVLGNKQRRKEYDAIFRTEKSGKENVNKTENVNRKTDYVANYSHVWKEVETWRRIKNSLLVMNVCILLIGLAPHLGIKMPFINKNKDVVLYGIINTENSLNLRENPSLDAEIVTKIPSNATVEILEENESYLEIDGKSANWLKVKYGVNVGWVWGGYVNTSNKLEILNQSNSSYSKDEKNEFREALEEINEEPILNESDYVEENSEEDKPVNSSSPFGNDIASRYEKGIGTPEIKFNKGDRTRLNDVNLDDLKIAENAVVSFRLIVNPDGKIERVETDTERTTTSNMLLIFEIRKRVVAQVRYSKSKGNDLEMFSYSITVSAD